MQSLVSQDSGTSLRVLQLVDGFSVGGAENLLVTLGLVLRSAGVDARFVALFDRPRSPVQAGLEAAGFRPVVLAAHGMRPATVRMLRDYLRDSRPDLVHAHLTYASILGVYAAAREGIPSVVTLHQFGSLNWRRPREAVREAVFRLVVGVAATRVIGVSTAVARYYARRGIPRRKLTVVPNALDLTRFVDPLTSEQRNRLMGELHLSPGARIVLCVAMLRPGKGVEVLLKAMGRILAAEPRAVLLIVGDGPERSHLDRLARAVSPPGCVRWLGMRTDVPLLLQLAEVCVLPTFQEALPTVLIEASAAGVVPVASNVGGVPEVVRHGVEGLLTAPGDERALAVAVLTVLQNHGLRLRLSQAARRRAQEFSPPVWARRLVEIYSQARPVMRILA